MEVHHHSDSSAPSVGTHRKKWTHYFWEFLMLFLAVFCGFLAEFKLEHTIEKSREKQYIRSFSDDLAADTIDLHTRITFCESSSKKADSLIKLLVSPDKEKNAGEIYYFFRLIHRSDVFNVNDRTIVQLRNAGGMRLISNKGVSDSMLSYYKDVEVIKFVYDELVEFRRSLRPHFPKILDGIDWGKVVDESNAMVRSDTPLKLRSDDGDVINTCIIILQNIKGINLAIARRLRLLRMKAVTTREFILKEYHLK